MSNKTAINGRLAGENRRYDIKLDTPLINEEYGKNASLLGEQGAASSLKELSSLPNDEVAEDMKCSTKTTSSSDINIACHVINGYMTAYCDSNTSTLFFDDDIERQILDTIKSSMDFYVDNENPFDSVDIVGVNYVGVDETRR